MKFSDLSEPEKATLQCFWSQCPEMTTTTGDTNDPTLGEREERILKAMGRAPDFILGDPIGRCDQLQYISIGKNSPFQKLYCANCGTELKKLEDDNFEMVCDCGVNGKKYDFDLITFDPNEHIQRKHAQPPKE